MSADLATAAHLGRALAATAIWHGDACTWLGPVPEPARGPRAVAVRPVGPELYDGAAGIGLVLAEVAAATDDPACRRAAAGALRAAVDALGRVPDPLRLGLHTGRPGVALAVARGAALLGDEALPARLAAVPEDTAGPRPAAYDLVAGRAGAVLALLALGDAASVLRAERMADEIVAEAHVHGAWTWPKHAPGQGLLAAGVSHGPAGVAHALDELAVAVDRPDLADAARAAIEAEQATFDAVARNWPREGADWGRDHGGVEVSQVHWCHGAPGIALARHRHWRRTGDGGRRAEAATALDTTARWTRGALAAGRGSYCLCHGLAGNAEILHECADAADGPVADEHVALAGAVADMGVEEHVRGGRPWPGGLIGGDPGPGLMTGLAGIARFYLRRSLPDLPSLLLPGGRGWASGGLLAQPASKTDRSSGVSSRVTRSSASASTSGVGPHTSHA